MQRPTGRSYDLISADSHVVEPPDIWERFLAEKYRDRAPKLVKDAEGGDAWAYDPDAPPAPLGLVSCVGIPRDQIKSCPLWMRFSCVRIAVLVGIIFCYNFFPISSFSSIDYLN